MVLNQAPDTHNDRRSQHLRAMSRRPSEWWPRSGTQREETEDRGRHLDRLFELHGAPDNI